MAKCRVIDRIAYTKGELKFVDDSKMPTEKTEKLPEKHGDICPMCGQYTLHHVEGCETCHACGYSKCAISW